MSGLSPRRTNHVPRPSVPRARLGFVRLALALASLVPAGACFESGPLGTSGSGLTPTDSGVEDAEVEAPDLPDLPDPVEPDAVPSDGASEVEDVSHEIVPTDTSAPDAIVDVATDVGPIRACLTHDDCAGLSTDDLCAGPIRCVDYGCRPDPGQAVTCASDDPCLESTCDPATGLCASRSLCSCESSLALPCTGLMTTWATSDPTGLRPAFPSFGACAAPVSPTVRIIQFTGDGRVRLEAGPGVSRFWVLDAESCDGTTCLAGGDGTVFFGAEGGRLYALAIEESGQQTAALRATCGLVREDRCANGLDDDGDGLTDCEDLDCDGLEGCVRPREDEVGLCSNGIDDDEDGRTDCADLDCDPDPACLQACEIPTGFTTCGFRQGLGTGGGKSRSTDYSCNPTPMGSKEVVYRFRPNVDGTVRIGFSTSANLTLHLLRETGRGCTPRDCVGMSTGDLWFQAETDATYYAVIDGPGTTTGSFDIDFDCSP